LYNTLSPDSGLADWKYFGDCPDLMRHSFILHFYDLMYMVRLQQLKKTRQALNSSFHSLSLFL